MVKFSYYYCIRPCIHTWSDDVWEYRYSVHCTNFAVTRFCHRKLVWPLSTRGNQKMARDVVQESSVPNMITKVQTPQVKIILSWVKILHSEVTRVTLPAAQNAFKFGSRRVARFYCVSSLSAFPLTQTVLCIVVMISWRKKSQLCSQITAFPHCSSGQNWANPSKIRYPWPRVCVCSTWKIRFVKKKHFKKAVIGTHLWLGLEAEMVAENWTLKNSWSVNNN